MQTADFIFYPQYDEVAVEVLNLLRGGARSTVHALRVYEIRELPATALPHAEEGRLFGSQTERASLRLETFYAGPQGDMFTYRWAGTQLHKHHGFLKNWYIAIANQIRYMRHAGENFFWCNMWQYHDPWWPSELGYRSSTPHYDTFALMFAMFEANDLTLMPCVEYLYSNALLEKNIYSDKDVRNGAPTCRAVSRTGHQASGARILLYNSLHPLVRDQMQRIVREITERYARYGSFKGIGWISGGFLHPAFTMPKQAETWDDALEYGWDDVTVGLFEQQTGLDVPVDPEDPERFQKRYRWITENHREDWIDFRCRALLDVHLQLRDTMLAIDPDAEYMPTFYRGPPKTLAAYVVLQDRHLLHSLRMSGFDPTAYKGQPNLELCWWYTLETAARTVDNGLLRTFNNLYELNELLDNGGQTAVFTNPGWIEPDVDNVLHKDWVWTRHSQANPIAFHAHPYYRQPLVDRLRQLTPATFPYVFTDGTLYTAQAAQRRPFAAAYRSIPKGDYRTLEGKGLDRNLVVRQSVQAGRRCVYVLNPCWWKTTVELNIRGEGALVDRVKGEVLDRSGTSLRMESAPYSLRVLEMDEQVAIVGADTEIDPQAEQWLAARVDYLNDLDRIGAMATIRKLGFAEQPLVTLLRIAGIRDALANGRCLRCQSLLDHPVPAKIMHYLKAKRAAERSNDHEPRSTYRVNLGTDEPYHDANGRTWLPDQSYEYGINLYGYTGDGSKTTYRGNIDIARTEEPEIYRTERFKLEGYCFQVPNGTYTVKLHFCEAWEYHPGEALMSVDIEGKSVLRDFDWDEAAGAYRTAFVKTLDGIRVTDNELSIQFSPLYWTKMNGIEVLPQR